MSANFKLQKCSLSAKFKANKKKPCGEPQGWDEKLYILEDYKKGVKYIGMQIVAPSF